MARFLTSVLVGAKSLDVNEPEAIALCERFLQTYTETLSKGYIRTLERETATGMIKDLLVSLKKCDRNSFLNNRTKQSKGQRKLKIRANHTQKLTSAERSKITEAITRWAEHQPDPQFYTVLDVARRIAGLGSLGVNRYIVLVEGNGSPHKNTLLDLKAKLPSCLQPYLTLPQPQWQNGADRTILIQQRVQGVPPALLATITIDQQPYVLRELQPTQDRLSLDQWNGKLRRLEKVMAAMAELVAWGQLRSSGREKSAIIDELIAFAQSPQWQKSLLSYTQDYRQQVETDYQAFCADIRNSEYLPNEQ